MYKRTSGILIVCVFLGTLSGPSRADGPAPQISVSATNPGILSLTVTNVVAGNTYHIEHLNHLGTNDWQDIYCFAGSSTNAHWDTSTTNTTGFYRALAETNHARVGQSAVFQTHYHNVMGSAYIVNNCTIELRNFYFDGGGIDVRVIVSPNSSFSPYTDISDDIVGTVFADDTLTLSLPESVNLDEVSYISIWCVDVSISFGDGMFQ